MDTVVILVAVVVEVVMAVVVKLVVVEEVAWIGVPKVEVIED